MDLNLKTSEIYFMFLYLISRCFGLFSLTLNEVSYFVIFYFIPLDCKSNLFLISQFHLKIKCQQLIFYFIYIYMAYIIFEFFSVLFNQYIECPYP